jgi:prepilin-type N-terminal cleavage/methylation domain-containing protein
VTTPASRPAEAGFSLVEVLVAVLLVAIVMAGLFPVTFKVALQSRQANIVAQQSAVLEAELAALQLASYQSLAVGTTCESFSSSGFPHTKCVTVTETASNRKQVTVTITPTGGSGVEPASSVIERSRGGGANPLNP